MLLECGINLLPVTLLPMQSRYIHTTTSYLKQMIPKNSVLEMTQPQPNTTSINIFTMLTDRGNKIYTALSNEKIPHKDCDTKNFIT